MDDMQNKIQSILNDPSMMQQIMSIAQSMNPGGNEQMPAKSEKRSEESSLPQLDMAAMQRLTGLARQTGIDKREQALLRALSAYLAKDRISKLERAMRAAKMAKLASSAIGSKSLTAPFGR